MDKPTRVLHVISSMTNGGAETFIMYQYRHIDTKQVQFDFLTSREGEYAYNDEIRSLGGIIYLIKPPKEQGAWGFVKDIKRILKADSSIKAVHAHTFLNCGLAMLGAFLGGAKIRIAHCHTTRVSPDDGLKRRIYNRLMRILVKLFATDYFACSNAAGENLYGRAIYGKKGRIIPNSIELERFENIGENDKNTLRAELQIPQGVPVYTNIGRLVDLKNQQFLIKIADRMKQDGRDFRMLFVGGGEMQEQLKQEIAEKQLEDRIIMTGLRQDIPAILAITDVFLLPSKFEGIPVTLVEAQASLKPSVCSENVSSQADIGLDMIKFLGIEEHDIDEWIYFIDKLKGKSFDRDEVFDRLRNIGYDSAAGAELLQSVYLGQY